MSERVHFGLLRCRLGVCNVYMRLILLNVSWRHRALSRKIRLRVNFASRFIFSFA